MKNVQHPSMSEYSEYNDQSIQHIDIVLPLASSTEQRSQLDRLLGAGFTWSEAVKLLTMREHLYTNAEIRQRIADDSRMHFVRWLYENGEMSEI